nr:hypothetical protein [Tanacetum cinerariifolium]
MSQFGQITNTQTYVVPFHTRKLFTTLRVNSPSFSGRIVPLFDSMLVQQGKGSGTPTEPHYTPSPEAQHTSHTTHSLPPIPSITTAPIPPVTSSETTPIRQYIRRARIAHLKRQHSELLAKFQAQEVEINKLKERVRLLKDREGVAAEGSGDDTPIKGRNLDEGKAVAERATSEAAEVPTGSGSIPTAGPPTAEVPTGSDVEYHQFASELPIERRIELISDLVKYQDNYTKIYKFQSQQRKPWTKKQKRDYYMAVIRSNLGWKVNDFRDMTIEEVKSKFNSVWKKIEDFIPMGSKEKAERIKRKGLSLEQESAKKFKPSEEVTKEAKSSDEVPEEKIKEMMQLVLIEEVENYSRMANDLILKIYKITITPRQQGIEFPLAEEVPTASEEGCHCQKKKEATARKITLLSKSRKNYQSKSNDNFTKSSTKHNLLSSSYDLLPSYDLATSGPTCSYYSLKAYVTIFLDILLNLTLRHFMEDVWYQLNTSSLQERFTEHVVLASTFHQETATFIRKSA